MFDATPNERAVIGGNNPPPFEAVRVHVEDLYEEAKNFLDGEPIASEGQAEAVSKLLDDLRKAKKAADDARKTEAKPFDDGKAEVQARYKPVLEKADLGADACKAALAPYLAAKEAEQRAKAEEARRQAEEESRRAAEAARAARADDLTAREQAEALHRSAELAAKAAKKAESEKAHATGGARAVTLRSYFTPVLTDGPTALLHYYAARQEDVEGFLVQLARQDVQAGKRTIPGFTVNEERRAV